jgi:hypothetical protein
VFGIDHKGREYFLMFVTLDPLNKNVCSTSALLGIWEAEWQEQVGLGKYM